MSATVMRGNSQAESVVDTPLWQSIVARSIVPEQIEDLSAYGRWWLARARGQMSLSMVAAAYLGVAAGEHASAEACSTHVVPDDLPSFSAAMEQARHGGAPLDCEFRLIDPLEGVRWFRLRSLVAESAAISSGVLIDVTSVKHAAMREKFNFALTQYLIGTDTLAEAVTKIIELVCLDLGWEWGAYWELGQDGSDANILHCKHFWHGNNARLVPFQLCSEAMHISPEHDLVGRVWRTGQAEWIDGFSSGGEFLRGALASASGLQSGYLFPVTYVTADGSLHRPGVLEFFSNFPRQREAQLPDLSAAIGALIALTAQRMTQQAQIRRLALSDEMTGLANRKHFHAALDAACHDGKQPSFGVLYIDLDQFKPINDALGHQAGNCVLIEFARRMQAVAPRDAVIGRLGGDEFAILASGSVLELDMLAQAVLQAARSVFIYEGSELSVSASIGISVFPQHGSSTAELLHAADAAMYLSKRNGRNLVSHYQDDGNRAQQELAGQLALLSELHHAHARNEFFLEYQAIFDSVDGRVCAVEALIRWCKPSGEIVRPDQFIPIAERSRLIVHLGRWVVEQVCRDLPLMHAAGMMHMQVHINMAAPEFLDSELPAELMRIVSQAGITSDNICLELTESAVMSQPEKSIPIMRELTSLGFSISLDDFGIAYSSLSLVKRLPLSSLKIDRLFISGVPHDRDDCAIVRAILELGRNMKIGVIAEGVETDAQLSFLRQFGCPVQGYLLGRPMSVTALIARHRKTKLSSL
ncbi:MULTISPECIES: EAL domain-containing protein [unclassified Undibacterium]|uniref:sensor domain-containing protein n=1 Tax=unclassified Undibacterium TaxID=2630295 RepID=UPI002AC9EA27|nr:MULTISPECIES: EAL domain-containing protein [unclassified Undibacterium]MEB0138097.1 EAL domain-containing protein [Undibacterium sp. CCC2.1]MEB0171148.1 EAL domain-containing protein [Undibacterium sp. CCC1.1]MEB0175193.1 EAL domain-containing protein [Undibacterium sp. CCC3.4]MEB0214222.1 EAL domain-containing protein [Undibacterium sp. 5I2]WPX45564.1 EAL domain-containing protein [Undibacterium sp. CCC3.4]